MAGWKRTRNFVPPIQIRDTYMLERTIRAIAGIFILASLILAFYVNTNWYWFTAFVGANLLQSALTKWCLMEELLKKFFFKQHHG